MVTCVRLKHKGPAYSAKCSFIEPLYIRETVPYGHRELRMQAHPTGAVRPVLLSGEADAKARTLIRTRQANCLAVIPISLTLLNASPASALCNTRWPLILMTDAFVVRTEGICERFEVLRSNDKYYRRVLISIGACHVIPHGPGLFNINVDWIRISLR